MLPVKEQLSVIMEGVEELLPEDLLEKKLERAVREDLPLVIKQGFDPTAPDLHLGHAVGLRKLRQFQDLGHRVVFLIGDFTALIGDPSGRSEMRPRMDREQVLNNAETYRSQVHKILDMDKLEMRFNSEWCMNMNFAEVLSLSSHYTVARMLERDDFSKRFSSQLPISIMEFFYPLVQGYDSVALKADVEVGGTDQKFNLLIGRHLQEAYGQEAQVILTLPLLEGTRGGDKMSKSLGNYIGIMEPAAEIFGKAMSIPDELLSSYYTLAAWFPKEEAEQDMEILKSHSVNPVLLKRKMARRLVDLYHGEGEGLKAEEAFNQVFVKKDIPDEMPLHELPRGGEDVWIVAILEASGLVKSRGEARRMIRQGAVSIDGEKVENEGSSLSTELSGDRIIKVGKRRFLRIRIT
ncbi:MAG: tyrosine--tRNA ligase [Candidatus Krumholzibacteria bacterium]|jgi:tyrosyl-tRNA synthetase|nr:tyrosine--tRNA ligase [Candidatus Krumholzibacteria bacterium]MDP6796974.1 tyrosine--tRNA ligase [Candidatus Krumholzibacteria bacterium]MDP7021080.1 tyrosine--tRNA ligase [Candidatus Krumholzibacteria bacterium]